MCGCNLVTPRLSAAVRRSSSGSLAMLAAMRRASSRISRWPQLGVPDHPRIEANACPLASRHDG